jgi:hypothetical protein
LSSIADRHRRSWYLVVWLLVVWLLVVWLLVVAQPVVLQSVGFRRLVWPMEQVLGLGVQG